MPVQYADGIMKEHLHTREAAGLFDVSHMGQIIVRARSGVPDDAAAALERCLPMDLLGLSPGRQRYGLLTNADGGILDDLMVARHGDHFHVVVNAARKHEDLALLQAALEPACHVAIQDSRSLIALQGPQAEAVLLAAGAEPALAGMAFMDVSPVEIAGVPTLVSRSGYTGEDGFEISLSDEFAPVLAERLCADARVKAIGLGARDSLRLEAGLCLHGNDIDAATSPVEAGLTWAVAKVRRAGGARAGGYPGARVIDSHFLEGVAKARVGLKPEGRAPVRAGAPVFASADDGPSIGTVTSGVFSPSLQLPIAMGYVPRDKAEEGTRLFVEVRGRRLPTTVAALPFVPTRFKRP